MDKLPLYMDGRDTVLRKKIVLCKEKILENTNEKVWINEKLLSEDKRNGWILWVKDMRRQLILNLKQMVAGHMWTGCNSAIRVILQSIKICNRISGRNVRFCNF